MNMHYKRSVTQKIALVVSAFSLVFGSFQIYSAEDSVPKASGSLASSSSEIIYESSNGTCHLTEQEEKSIEKLANNCGLSCERLKSTFLFKVGDKSCALVPICDCDTHRNCFVRIFSESDPDYIKYYNSGRLQKRQNVLNWFNRSLQNGSKSVPRSVTFVIKVEDKAVGRIGIGPLHSRSGVNTEIGYALEKSYSHQGIMTKAVNSAIAFLQYLKDCGKKIYNFTKLRATAKFDNKASNAILINQGFAKSDSPSDDGYGAENEYFYQFK